MSLTPEQYIALSTLVYESTSKNDIKAPIGNIISRIENRNKLEYAALSSLSSYILLDYISTPSGFQAAAFQSPSGEIVFSFKGTDAGDGSEFSKDIANADEQIFTGSSKGLPAQFVDAENFVMPILRSNPDVKCSFTGHFR